MAHYKEIKSDKIFDFVVNGFLIVLTIVVLYPLYFIVIASFSNPDLVNAGKVILIPKEITIKGYEMIFSDDRVINGYLNTFMYTFGYSLIAVFMTLLSGYALSRKELYGKKLISFIFLFTMYFKGGLIPTYLVMQKLHLVNNPLIIVLLNSIIIFYVIITKSYFESTISNELYDSARIDGCNNWFFFIKIVLPVSKAIIAVLVIYYAVYQWNSYFNALIFLNDQKYYPLQLILREILVQSQNLASSMDDIETIGEMDKIANLVRYGLIIVASVPVLILYPFLQRYFVQGVMVGSLKG